MVSCGFRGHSWSAMRIASAGQTLSVLNPRFKPLQLQAAHRMDALLREVDHSSLD
jgi:hypothetical protein